MNDPKLLNHFLLLSGCAVTRTYIFNFQHCKLNFFKKKLHDPFFTMGYCLKASEPFRGGGLLFTTNSPEILGTHLINLGRMKGWVWPWNHLAALNTGPLDWELWALTTCQKRTWRCSKEGARFILKVNYKTLLNSLAWKLKHKHNNTRKTLIDIVLVFLINFDEIYCFVQMFR